MGFKQKWADSLMKSANYGEKKTPKELVQQRKMLILMFTIIEYLIWLGIGVGLLFLILNANTLING